MMENFSSKDASDKELELEDLWSELHSLKKLYGLLQTSNAKIPNEDNGIHCLDDKTKGVLKKLLDGATHQALQSQAKIVCHTPEKTEKTEPKLSVSTEMRGDGDELQKSQPVTTPVVEGTAGQPKGEPQCIGPVAEPKDSRKPHPKAHEGHLTRQNSRASVAVSDHRSTPDRHHHRRRSRKPSVHGTMGNNEETQAKQTKNNDELLAIVPAEKRARVEPTAGLSMLGQSSRNQTRVVGRVDRELTHSKHGDTKERPRRGRSSGGGPGSRPPSRPGSVKDREGHYKESMPRGCMAPSRPGSSVATRRRPPPAVPSRMRSIACSSAASSSQTMRTESSASSTMPTPRHRRVARGRAVPARAPRRMPSRRKVDVGPPPPKKGEGRLKRFADKLAVIFHHHHHHHHHIHGGARRRRTPWSYLKGKGREVVKAPARATGQQQHGYLYALLDGLVRHVRGMRRRKKGAKAGMAKAGGRKKSHWWQRFRRRGGVRLASKKTPRLRLGFNRAHSRNNRNKKGV